MAKSNTRKLICSITHDWAYCTEERFQELRKKFGSIAKIATGYQSREGKKMIKAAMVDCKLEGDELAAKVLEVTAEVTAACLANPGKNKIFCVCTGERMYISPERLAHKMEVLGCTEDELRASYTSRVAARLQKSLPQEMFKKDPADLSDAENQEVLDRIKEMALEGKLPAPSAPKGSKKKAEAAPEESKKDRKNRLAREKRAAAKAAKEAAKEAEKATEADTKVLDTVPEETEVEQTEEVPS